MLTSPVLELQSEAGATLAQAHGWRLPKVYSSVDEECRALSEDVGLLDRSHIGRLEITGEDGIDLLDRLSTNRLEELSVGQGMYTVLTSNKGRVLDVMFVLRLDDRLSVLTAPSNRRKVADWIDFYTITEDAAVRDVTEDSAMLALVGPKAAVLLDELAGQEISSMSRYDSVSAGIGRIDILVMRTDFNTTPAYDLVVPASQARRLWKELLDRGEGSGIKPVGMDASEVVRVEQGVPEYDKELTEDVNPLEANLIEFISFNKGCYVGQEVVARLNTYEKVQRRLVGLSWDSDDVASPGDGLYKEGKKVGAITSAVRSPRLGKGIGLGYVRKAHAQPGVRLTMDAAGDEVTACVEALPFSP